MNRPPRPPQQSVFANGRGMHLTYVNTDLNGLPRAVVPYYGVPDIGAYEYPYDIRLTN